ncbi:SDR family oxidoreductase [Sediminicola luteus]|uniref:D-mannonate oxidoreductase n=1 Tax=Sediminicola luteus TaxID=319238 RepID=A0A2A4G708_9FLAO|nr:SDR family oxidoreductase [Sediminicola luteus]PCE64749.1 D-mannonate oxidoreductase [Sediminicola luteus]
MKTNNTFDINGKVCVITGGAGVLGSTIARHLLAEGAHVAILSLAQDDIDKITQELDFPDDRLAGYVCNVLDADMVAEVAQQIVTKWGKVDALLNAAGGNMAGATIGPDQTILDMDLNDFDKVSKLNLTGSLIPCMAFGKHMAGQGFGSIINYSSMTAYRTITRVVGYSASKAALSNLTQWLAVEFALKFSPKIRVNAIAPGFFIGNQNRRLLTNEDGSYTERGNTIIANTPMKRFGEAEELNGALHWLISDASSFVTGTILPIDGGFNAFSGV